MYPDVEGPPFKDIC